MFGVIDYKFGERYVELLADYFFKLIENIHTVKSKDFGFIILSVDDSILSGVIDPWLITIVEDFLISEYKFLGEL